MFIRYLSFYVTALVLLLAKACKDESACAQYFEKPKPVDLCTYAKTKQWFQANCKKSCGLCHLYTTLPSTTRTLPTFPMKNCGKTFTSQSRVIAGTHATKGAWPWQVALHYKGRFLCGGSIVSSQWIVTAAHCVTFKSADKFEIIVGEYNRNISEGTEESYKAERILMHGSYTRPTRKANDIALIKLTNPIRFNTYVQRVCLPDQWMEPPQGTQCFITGWGKMQHPGGAAILLQQAPLTTVNTTTCTKLNSGLKVAVDGDSMLCAGSTEGSQSGCHGDSGGPFVCQEQNGLWYLHGIVSWGSPTCNSKHAYSVFSKVSFNRMWLDRYIWY